MRLRIKARLRKFRQTKVGKRAMAFGGAAKARYSNMSPRAKTALKIGGAAIGAYGAYRAARRINPGIGRGVGKALVGAGLAYAGHKTLSHFSPKYANASKKYIRTVGASARLARMRAKGLNAWKPTNGVPPPLPTGHRRVKKLNPELTQKIVDINNRGMALQHDRQAKLARIQARRKGGMTPSQRRRLHIAAAAGVTAAAMAVHGVRKRVMTPRNIAIQKGYRNQQGKLVMPKALKHGASFFHGLASAGLKRRFRSKVRHYMS